MTTIYREKQIKKVEEGKFSVCGFVIYFESLEAAKDAIDEMWWELEAEREINRIESLVPTEEEYQESLHPSFDCPEFEY